MTRRRRGWSLLDSEDVDPLAFVPNLFDAILVLVVALLVALSSAHGRAERSPSATERLDGFVDTGVPQAGDGRRLGVAYRLADGKVVYVPE